MRNRQGRCGRAWGWLRYPFLNWILDLLPPVSPVVEKIIVVPGVEHGLHEQSDDLHVAHVAEAPVGRVNTSTNDPQAAVPNLLAQQIVFLVQGALLESAEPVERGLLQQQKPTGNDTEYTHRARLFDCLSAIQHTIRYPSP